MTWSPINRGERHLKCQTKSPQTTPSSLSRLVRENANEDGTTPADDFGQAAGAGSGEDADAIHPALAREMPAGRLEPLTEAAKNYARNARSENTHRAYESDWRQFSSWLRRQGFDPLPPDPQTVGLHLAACAGGVSAGARNIGGLSAGARNIGAVGKGRMAAMRLRVAQGQDL